MEPFDIRSTPARIAPGQLTVMALLFLMTLAVVLQAVWVLVMTVGADERSATLLLLLGAVTLLAGVCIWLSVPQVLVLRRYLGEDRGKQVLTFRLDREGWHWMQVGTDVLMPWDGLRISVVERTPELVTIRFEHADPVLVGTDPVSRLAHRTLRRQQHTDVPFTHTDPTEDELAAAIEAQSGGRVVLER